jgi:hypothetical protein
MATLEEITQTIKNMDGAAKFLGSKEIKALPSILWEDEKLERLVTGIYNNGNGILAATNKRLVFVDKGLIYGLKVEDFPYDKITSIQYQQGMVIGEITIYASGNKAEIKWVDKALTKSFAEHVRARITATTSSVAPQPVAAQVADDPIAKLERLASLKEKGILSEEEFRQQKAAILGTAVEQPVMHATVVTTPQPIKPAQPSLTEAEERYANHLLDVARAEIKEGRKTDARATLEKLVAQYPNTRAARTANDALTKRATGR